MIDLNNGNFCRRTFNLIQRVVMDLEISNEATTVSIDRILSTLVCIDRIIGTDLPNAL